MIDGFDSSVHQFLLGLEGTNRRLQRAQQQISSGLRVSIASDDPDAVSDILQTRAEVASVSQSKTNLGSVKTEVDTAEQVTGLAIKVVEQARDAGAQGSNGLVDATQRQLLASKVDSYLSQLVNLSGTRVDGRYLFSGDQDQQTPYTIDLPQASPVSTYAGSPATRQVRDANGNQISISRTAQQIFDSPGAGESVFSALLKLRAGLQQNDPAMILAAQSDVSTALDHLNAEQSQYGIMQDQINSAIDQASQRGTQLQTQLSNLEDADVAAAAMELTQAILHQTATLSARSRMPQESLFSYLV